MRRTNDDGVALIAAILVTALMSALLIGFVAMVIADQRAGLANRDQTTAYAGAHAGLERLTSDLGELFATNYRPRTVQVRALTATVPVLPGITFVSPGGGSGYNITFTDAGGYPQMEATPRTISSGPYQGLQGSVTPYTIEVTARASNGAEVRMRRTMQTVLIPAFQFGIFSENDLSFFAGPNFNFGGRVHTNSNLFLAEGDGNTLTLADRVTAVQEVIRTNLSNGWATSASYTGTVNVIRAPGNYRALRAAGPTEGSLVGTVGSAENEPTWTDLSVGTYNGNIRNGRTGARRLDLPLVQMGAQPIDLIRRPVVNSAENVNSPEIFGQRYYARASLRILLSDTAADLLGLPGVTATAPVRLADLRPVANYGGNPPAWYPINATHAPVASAGGVVGAAYNAANGYWTATYQPLIDGFIKIETQRTDMSTWVDVTQEILSLGFTGRNLAGNVAAPVFNNISAGPACADPSPDAIIRIQRLIDTKANCGTGSINPQDYIPNVLYDPREGDLRDSNATGTDTIYAGGVVHYIELDARNVARWFAGLIGTGANGPVAENSDGGYVVYVSDRRTNQRIAGFETGEYGFEDIVNRSSATSIPPNGVLETGEDLNGNGVLDIYGQNPILPPNLRTGLPATVGGATRPWTVLSTLWTDRQARVNPPLFFRRALKVVNGAQAANSALTVLPAGTGLTIVSENPVYVQGNYNTSTAGNFGAAQTDHRPSAVIADAVTLLSNNWNDIRSFLSSQDPAGRPGSTSWYRLGIVSGKGLSFQQPTFACYQDFGTDGGAHNFLRFIEDWGGDTLNYRGSIISFYASRQGVGTYKCCTNVYSPPTRGYNFDVEFLQLNLLPPKSPAFRDVNTLTFRQVLRATQ